MNGRTGCYVERALFVPPALAPLLVTLTDGAKAEFRRHGMVMPAALVDWLADLGDFARREDAAAVVVEEPSAWVDVATAVRLFEQAGVPISSRAITALAASGRLRAKRDGRPWLLSIDAVDAEITGRKHRKRIGSRYSDDSAECVA